MKKIILISAISLFIGSFTFGQSYKEMKTSYEQAGSPKVRTPLSPTASTIFSFLIPGLGQMYAGEYLRGTGFLLANVTANLVMLSGFGGYGQSNDQNCAYNGTCGSNNSELIMLGLISAIGINIWSMVDASKVAHVKNFNKNKSSEPNENQKNETSFLPQISPVLIQSQNQLSPGIGLSYSF